MTLSETLNRHLGEILAVIGRYDVANPRAYITVDITDEGEELDVLAFLVDNAGAFSIFDLVTMEAELKELLGVPVAVRTPGSFPQKRLDRILELAESLQG
jgi:predicted nucleotidyltransferase